MKNKVCIITGANAGIGKKASIQIASKGYHVIMACRNKERGKIALEEVKKLSKSDEVELEIVDMSLKESIKSFCDRINKQYDNIDVLIHNAASFDITQETPVITAEGFESIWMTNYIGPVYMTSLLIDKIKKSDDPRIITVSSKGLIAMPLLKIDLKDPEFLNRKFTVTKAYYQSKRALLMYTYWLAKQYKDIGICVNAIRVTAVKLDSDRIPNVSPFKNWVYKQKAKKSISTEEMAKTYTYLATSNDVKGITGKYFDENNKFVNSNSYTTDPKNIEDVINLTNKYL